MIKSQLKSSHLTEEMRDSLEAIRIAELNALESFHTEIEKKGLKLLSCKNFQDFKFLESKSELFDMVIFLMFQYARTNAMKQYFLKSADTETKALAKNGWNILSCIVASAIARNLCLDPHLSITILENHTNESLLTSDQPVFNLQNDKTDEFGNVLDFELYYPISPKLALTVYSDNIQSRMVIKRNLDEDAVTNFNQKVISNAHFFVFSDSKRQLESHVQEMHPNSV